MTTIDKPYLDLTFAHKYLVEFLPELPGYPTQKHYFPGNSIEGGKDGLLIKFLPQDGPAWLGCFSFGFAIPEIACRVFILPPMHLMLVIANGKGYWVSAADPSLCSILKLLPILDVRVVKEQALLVLSTFTAIGIIASDGTFFKSQQLCWDDLRILSIEGGLISGTGFDPTSPDSNREWVFDLKNLRMLKSAYSSD